MEFEITISEIKPIQKLHFSIDLSKKQILCITGKNGTGKTTLFKCIRLVQQPDTLKATAAPYILTTKSTISYNYNNTQITFKYSKPIDSLESRQSIPDDMKSMLEVELAMPHGERFTYFRKLSNVDKRLRSAIATREYGKPEELILILQDIYGNERFQNLKRITTDNSEYYIIITDETNGTYIREDHFSSGEYFLINLYKTIRTGKKLIVIDEIDISLDARVQVKLTKHLRILCSKYETNIVFSTHSLALMKTLNSEESYYIEHEQNTSNTTINPQSYNFIKSVMFGFKGYDKYILTEDECLAEYIESLISTSNRNVFFKYKVIHIGGAQQVIDLAKRNTADNFLTEDKNVLIVLDGDQKDKKYIANLTNVRLLPFLNIEIQIYHDYKDGKLKFNGLKPITNRTETNKAKNLYKQLTKKRHNAEPLMKKDKIYEYLKKLKPDEVNNFQQAIVDVLSPK